jgi:hypothetical protein
MCAEGIARDESIRSRMGMLLRKSIAIVAAYAIVIQALWTGVAVAAHVTLDPFTVICSSQNSASHPDVPPHHDADCGLCIIGCQHASAVPVIFDHVIATRGVVPIEHAVAWLTAPLSRTRREPHASRAPPILT